MKTALVDLQTVRAVRGLNAIGVLALVDSGQFRFVWDVSPVVNQIPCLRFLADEIFQPDKCAGLTAETALELVLGYKQTFTPGEIERQWVVCHQTIMRLRHAGEIERVNGRLTRASLAAFLQRRLQ